MSRRRSRTRPDPSVRPASGTPSDAPIVASAAVDGLASRRDERALEGEILKIPYVTRVTASAARREVVIESSREIPPWAIERAIRLSGLPASRDAASAEPAHEQPTGGDDPRSSGTEPSVTTIVPVAGMTCRSCEIRIQRHVSRIPSVRHVAASAARGRVVIESARELPTWAVERAIEAAGYAIGETPWVERDRDVWFEVGAGVAIVAGFAVMAQMAGLTDLAAGAGDLATGGLVVALLIGLAAGVSTCMALAGGIVLALSASFQSSRAGRDVTIGTRLRPALVFLGGRVAGYAILGAVLGAIGASVTLPPLVTAALMIAVAVVMTLVGTRLTGVSPRIAGWSPTLPMGLGRRLGLTDGGSMRYSDGRAALLGFASFFLPCGFTQAIQVYALSTGSPLFGGALLATFAIGTAPGLLAVAGLPAIVPAGARPMLLRFVGVVVLAFALVNGNAGLRLAGIGLPFGLGTASAAGVPKGAVSADGVQTLATYQEVDGYGPSDAAIYANMPTRWTIDSRSSASCSEFLVVPSLGIQKHLRPGENIIELPPLPAGSLQYSCAMGMFGGSIAIVDRPVAPGSSTGG